VDLRFDPQAGLIPAIVQDRLTGEIRMVAWMNREALEQTLMTKTATFYSRSRQRLWVKGETSGHTLAVHQVVADCDADVLVVLVDPHGPSCHTGQQNCFFHRVDSLGALAEEARPVQPFTDELERVILARTQSTAQKSYTRSLLDAGVGRIGEKLEEEATELTRALAGESDDRVLSEAADLFFHMLVGLRARGLPFRSVLEKLEARTGQSGHAEKASRKPSPSGSSTP
jgi:phosphoribosyl-ATP pyrophosphohydrolase/phosphoribosyl-AMP cyclohydrolase